MLQVLGLKSQLPTSNSFDMDTMENDITKRTHNIMMDALRETLPDVDTNLLDLSNENLDTLSSSSMGSVANEDVLTSVKSKDIKKNELDPLENVGIWSNEGSGDANTLKAGDSSTLKAGDSDTLKATSSNRPPQSGGTAGSNLLLDFDETSSGPALPEKKRQYERVSSAFNDEPLIDLAIDNNMSSGGVKRQESSTSMITGPGGLNAILQNAVVPSPTAVKNAENPWSPIEKKEDPWRMSKVKEENDDVSATHGFENDFKVGSPEKKQSPVQSNVGSVESNYAEYAERVKKSPGLRKKFGIELPSFGSKDDEKTPRKKSQGAWLKDKFSTLGRLRTGNQNSSSSSSNNSSFKKYDVDSSTSATGVIVGGGDGSSDKGVNNKTPTSPRGTPMEASERSKKKSLSFISKSSMEEEGLYNHILILTFCYYHHH